MHDHEGSRGLCGKLDYGIHARTLDIGCSLYVTSSVCGKPPHRITLEGPTISLFFQPLLSFPFTYSSTPPSCQDELEDRPRCPAWHRARRGHHIGMLSGLLLVWLW